MENILLGSGKLYIMINTDGVVPADATLEVEDNLVGEISGGAQITYKPEFSEIVGDSNKILKRYLTKEEVEFVSGVLTWNLKNLERLSVGATITEDVGTGVKILKVGGSKTINQYIIHFVHEKEDGSFVKASMVGNASEGFSFKFNPKEATIIDSKFKALSQSDGTLLILKEIPAE